MFIWRVEGMSLRATSIPMYPRDCSWCNHRCSVSGRIREPPRANETWLISGARTGDRLEFFAWSCSQQPTSCSSFGFGLRPLSAIHQSVCLAPSRSQREGDAPALTALAARSGPRRYRQISGINNQFRILPSSRCALHISFPLKTKRLAGLLGEVRHGHTLA